MDPSGTSTIKLGLHELEQLFDAMDSSPLVERDLDSAAENFIVGSARELPAGHELELVIVVSVPPADFTGVQDGVRRYFATRAELKRLELRQLFRRGRLSLAGGLVFLVVCLLLGELMAKTGLGATADIIREGLTIGGWVAMWRPLEICLYDWWPLYEERRRLARLSRIRVQVVAPEIGQARFVRPNKGSSGPGKIAATAA
jgi:hypothetical protein